MLILRLVATCMLLCIVRGGVFPEKYQLKYSYRAVLNNSIQGEKSTSSYSYAITASINVIGFKDKVSVTLEDISYALNSESTTKIDQTLTEPFGIEYRSDGIISNILLNPDEKIWSTNIKKGIASLLQMKFDEIEKQSKFSTEEPCVRKMCLINYTVQQKSDSIEVQKRDDEMEYDFSYNISPGKCNPEQNNGPIIKNEKKYVLKKQNNQWFIENIETVNDVSLNAFNQNNDPLSCSVKQSLKLTSSNPFDAEIQFDRLAKEDLKLKAIQRSTNDRTVLIDSLKTRLELLVEMLETKVADEANPEIKNHRTFQTALDIMRSMDEDTLMLSFDTFKNTSSTILQPFVSMLPLIGSQDSTSAIIRIIKVYGDSFDTNHLIREIPFNVNYPSQKIVFELFNLIETISPKQKNNLILSVATLASKAISLNPDSSEYRSIIDHYINRFESSTNYTDQLVYLSALSNIDVGSVNAFLLTTVKNQKIPIHLRSLALHAAKQSDLINPQATYWSILSDDKQDFELRSTALDVIMEHQYLTNVAKLRNFFEKEEDSELYNLYYTKTDGMSRSVAPCDASYSKMASQMMKTMPKPRPKSSPSSNFLLDYFESNFGFGATVKISVVGNIFKHDFVALKMETNPQIAGFNLNQDSFYLYIHFNSTVKQRLLNRNRGLSVYLHALLKYTFGTSNKIELITRRNGKVVLVKDYYENFMELAQSFQKENMCSSVAKFSSEQKVRGDTVMYTYLGVPVVFFVDMPTFQRTRCELASGMNLEYSYHLAQFNHQVYGIKASDPFGRVWIETRRNHIAKTSIPFELKRSANNFSMKLIGNDLSYQTLVYSDIYLDYMDASEKVLKVDKTVRAVQERKNQSWETRSPVTDTLLRFETFDCERSLDLPKLGSTMNAILWDIHNKYYDKNNSGNDRWSHGYLTNALMAIRYSWALSTTLPGRGSCGIKLMAKQNRTELDFNLSSTRKITDLADRHASVMMLSKINASNAERLTLEISTKPNFELQLTLSRPNLKDYKICMERRVTKNYTAIEDNYTLKYGDTDESACPEDGTSVEIENLWTHDSKNESTSFEECMNASATELICTKEETLFDRLDMNLKHVRASNYVKNILPEGLKWLLGEHARIVGDKTDLPQDTQKLTFKFPSFGSPYVYLNTSDLILEGAVRHSRQNLIRHLVPSGHVEELFEIPLYSKQNCHITPVSYTDSIDRNVSYDLTDDWTEFVAGQCPILNSSMTIAFKMFDDNKMALQMILSGRIIEIIPIRGFNIRVDGEALDDKYGYFTDELFDYKVSKRRLFVKFPSMKSFFNYDGTTANLQMSGDFYCRFYGRCFANSKAPYVLK